MRPASAVGLTAEAELLDAVVADVGGRPAALPLLSTALVGTWERRRGDRLTLAGYLEAGGVAGALSRAAGGRLRGSRRAGSCARAAPARAARGHRRRRRARPASACPLPSWTSTGRTAPDAGPWSTPSSAGGCSRWTATVLDVAHEALLTAWPRLARWLEDDAVGRAVRRHLDPGRAGVASRRRAGGGAVPRGPPRRRARLGGRRAGRADRGRAEVPRGVPGARRRRADRGTRAGGTGEAAARRRTRRLAVGLAAVLVVALVAAGLAVRAQSRPSRPRRRPSGSRSSPMRTGWPR